MSATGLGDVWTDVVVVGGGVTGSAVSVELGTRGLSSVIVDRGDVSPAPMGESLSGAARSGLQRLGVFDAFLQQGHEAGMRSRSLWGSARSHVREFLLEPYGAGWQIDRGSFQDLLSERARACGATRLEPAVARLLTKDDSGWLVRLEHSRASDRKGAITVHAKFAVDATGRSAWVARQQGTVRTIEDSFTAHLRVLEGCGVHEIDYTTTVESRPEGWWYSAHVPKGKHVIAVFCECEKVGGPEWSEWFAALETVSTCIPEALLPFFGAPTTRRVEVSRSSAFAGDGWIAAGDAAFSHDPLSGHGLTTGLWSGILAAEAVADSMAGCSGSLEKYCATLEDAWERDRRIRNGYYREERRWPAASFWSHRRVPGIALMGG